MLVHSTPVTTDRQLHGILDDETYDWFAIVKGMLASGGDPAVVDERLLVEAYDLARENVAVILSSVQRGT